MNVKNKENVTPLHLATERSRAFAIIYLQENGADIDCLDNNGKTPMHWACEHSQETAMYYLQPFTKAYTL